ncbi:hypothetical protein LB521_27630 [Mesorhizobium sp. BR-1-1-8]|uniref:hypothetical protein n=1 Tax=Mesorhizobium sp. BR-1-1-8 TaxID=2876659 RepID=UPI001CCA691F|nr:hypothetical protein [Mesorhizobium sp. BR-1-1-8]MBZ9984908.1 hypothetical protein [Mesorhizobium sp. BR-1-1-8]
MTMKDDGGMRVHASLRDHFAGQALSQPYPYQFDDNWPLRDGAPTKSEQIASWAYRIADAMIAERSK